MKKILGLAFLIIVISGCGQSGKLYLPDQTPPAPPSDNTVNRPS